MPTLTITTTAAQAQRIATAFGITLNKRSVDRTTQRDATMAEVKEEVINFITSTVLNYETDVAQEAARRSVPDIKPT